jgi:predicted dehydrogenase
MTEPVRVGLVGAGPWAQLFTAPLLARGPDCSLAAVWARRRDVASELAAKHGAIVAGDLDELFATCDAVAFAVPPDVQAELAVRAARAGRHVLLEKPVGMTLAQAEAVADAVAESGVASQLVLTNRYLGSMRRFLDDAAGFDAFGGRSTFLGGGAIEGSYFGTPWRLEQGGLLDLGPHVLDAIDAALGRIVEVRATGDSRRLVAITCEHERGAISHSMLSGTTPVEASGLVVELFGPTGALVFDTTGGDPSARGREYREAMATIAREFATAVRSGVSHDLDVRRGLHLQRLIETATGQLADR